MENYIKRNMEAVFLRTQDEYPALLITGPRQTGKTTMLTHLMKTEGRNRTLVSLDDYDARTMALGDPVLFFQNYKPPLLISGELCCSGNTQIL